MAQVCITHTERVYILALKFLNLLSLLLQFITIEFHSVVHIENGFHQDALLICELLKRYWVLICLNFKKVDSFTFD